MMMHAPGKKWLLLFPVFLCLALSGCTPAGEGVPPAGTASPVSAESEGAVSPEGGLSPEAVPAGIRVFLDGQLWSGDPSEGVSDTDLTVLITRGGDLLIALPFSENHLVTVRQPDGSENTVMLTGSLVRMADANCSNHDCMEMGEVTRENLQDRILGGFIVCLPHQIVVEVREP